jgi:hypothetical protein
MLLLQGTSHYRYFITISRVCPARGAIKEECTERLEVILGIDLVWIFLKRTQVHPIGVLGRINGIIIMLSRY